MSRRSDILAFVAGYQHRHGWAPTLAEIGAAVGLRSKSTVHAHLVELERQGFIERGGQSRQIRLVRAASGPGEEQSR